jgi:hypothetical protein
MKIAKEAVNVTASEALNERQFRRNEFEKRIIL